MEEQTQDNELKSLRSEHRFMINLKRIGFAFITIAAGYVIIKEIIKIYGIIPNFFFYGILSCFSLAIISANIVNIINWKKDLREV